MVRFYGTFRIEESLFRTSAKICDLPYLCCNSLWSCEVTPVTELVWIKVSLLNFFTWGHFTVLVCWALCKQLCQFILESNRLRPEVGQRSSGQDCSDPPLLPEYLFCVNKQQMIVWSQSSCECLVKCSVTFDESCFLVTSLLIPDVKCLFISLSLKSGSHSNLSFLLIPILARSVSPIYCDCTDYLIQLMWWKSLGRESRSLNSIQLLIEWKLYQEQICFWYFHLLTLKTQKLLPCSLWTLLLQQFSLFANTEIIVRDLTGAVFKLAVVMGQARWSTLLKQSLGEGVTLFHTSPKLSMFLNSVCCCRDLIPCFRLVGLFVKMLKKL